MSPPRPTSGYLLVAAGDAGSTDRQAIGQALRVLAADAPTQLRTTAEPDELHTALDDLAGRRLVVAGGDGTVHLVVAALLDRQAAPSTPVGIVPLGTGNDLAHDLGLPLDPAAAAARVVRGATRDLDILRHGSHVAVNAAHAGFGVAAARQAQRLKPVLGVAGYRLGALWAGATHTGVRASVTVDDQRVCHDQRVLLVAVMNGGSIGGDTPLCPSADPADGRLDVVVVVDRPRAQRAVFAAALSRGRHLALAGVTHRQGRRARIELSQDTWNVDGELDAGPPAREWRVQPAAWTVVV